MKDVFAGGHKTVLVLREDQRRLVIRLISGLSSISGAFFLSERILVDLRVADRTLLCSLAMRQPRNRLAVVEVAWPQKLGNEELRSDVALQPADQHLD